ncbi:MAG: hypothetical protein JXK95_02450 [Bacteroidales bacterium]|nr:hypothetical protein [Bacteroidales bacterium]
MKIRHRLSLSLTDQILLIVLIIFAFFFQNYKLRQVSNSTVDSVKQISDVNNFVLLSKDFENGKISFDELNIAESALSRKNPGTTAVSAFDSLWLNLQHLNRLKAEKASQENLEIQPPGNAPEMTTETAENSGEISKLINENDALYADLEKSLTEESINSINSRMGTLTSLMSIILIVFLLIVLVLTIINLMVSKDVKTIIKHLNYNLHRLSEGDLTVKTSEDLKKRRDEVGELSRSISKLKWDMRKIIGEIRIGADSVAGASRHISISAQAMSQGSNQQAASVEDICTTIEQITASIKQNAENSQTTEKISADAQEGIEVVNEKASRSLEATKEITDRIQIINDIAFQTNILALNAAVEAARAGEHGKGFAVVAAEVRKLAEKSKQAADQVVGLARMSFDLAEETGQKMAETLPQIIKTSRLIQEISASSLEQENGVNQVNAAIQQLNNVTLQNAAASEELATSSEQLNSQAENLRDLITFFNIDGESDKDQDKEKKIMLSMGKEDHVNENNMKEETGMVAMTLDESDENREIF